MCDCARNSVFASLDPSQQLRAESVPPDYAPSIPEKNALDSILTWITAYQILQMIEGFEI